jgi:hypothetical protein
MSKLLFHLRGVPEDEATEVRELLTTQDIAFYETSAGNWGASMPALWLAHDDDLEKARTLLDSYQQQRYISQRQAYLQCKQAGQHNTLRKAFAEKPLLCMAYLFAISMTVLASVKLVYEMGL